MIKARQWSRASSGPDAFANAPHWIALLLPASLLPLSGSEAPPAHYCHSAAGAFQGLGHARLPDC